MNNPGGGLLAVVSSPSGGGKTTIAEAVRERLGLDYSVSATTRPPRPGEKDGIHYKFLSKNEFLRYIDDGGFIEWAEVHGELYGTEKKQIIDRLDKGRAVLLDIDVQGALNIKKQFPEAVLIFIAPPSMQILEERLRKRGTNSGDSVRMRLERAAFEMENSVFYDYTVLNDDLETAISSVCVIIKEEMAKRQGEFYEHDNTD